MHQGLLVELILRDTSVQITAGEALGIRKAHKGGNGDSKKLHAANNII
jgi:hypothetical protein